MSANDDELEALLEQLAPTPEARAQLLEEHRQLEKDLLRLADPLPPADFLAGVMKKVRLAPAPLPSRIEMGWAVGILGVALAASLIAFSSAGGTTQGLGVQFAQMMLWVRSGFVGFASALSSVWRTAALPVTVGLSGTFLMCMVALRHVAGRGGEARVRT